MDTIQSSGSFIIGLFVAALVLIVVMMVGLMLFSRRMSMRRGAVSPYSHMPMMLGVDLSFSMAHYVEEFLKGQPQPENPPFDMKKAAICQETGRIFPDVVNRGEVIALDWSFLKRRYPGNWVSWGSLPEVPRAMIKMCHRSVERFQMNESCPELRPEAIDRYHAFLKPGPLYVDVATKTLMGWQNVPGTPFEVLVVKKPDYESIDEMI